MVSLVFSSCLFSSELATSSFCKPSLGLFPFGRTDDKHSDVLGFVFPAYCTIKAIESKGKDDDTQWLIYWLVFGGFTVAEYFSPTICYVFSWYFVVKFFFILWLLAPGSNVRPLPLRTRSPLTPCREPRSSTALSSNAFGTLSPILTLVPRPPEPPRRPTVTLILSKRLF
jgi:hypothetical protein